MVGHKADPKRNLLVVSTVALHFVLLRVLCLLLTTRTVVGGFLVARQQYYGQQQGTVPTIFQLQERKKNLAVLEHSKENAGDIIISSSNKTTLSSPLSGKSFRKKSQVRREHSNRRPRYYWSKLENIEQELEEFWIHYCGVAVVPTSTKNNAGQKKRRRRGPCIPNETLLNYFGRHDLRAAIVNVHGGRDVLSEKLRGAPIMPGKWKDAVASSPELQSMLRNATFSFSKESPPLSPQQQKKKQRHYYSHDNASLLVEEKQEEEEPVDKKKPDKQAKKWTHKNGRKPKGYWSLQLVVSELYQYLDNYRTKHGRPAVWMPRPAEIASEGREDLKLAMTRYGGAKKIGQLAGLISFREWNYFEGQYELLLILKQYLDEFGDYYTDDQDPSFKYKYFPTVAEVRCNGYDRLFLLIQLFGGRTLLAGRFGMVQNLRGSLNNHKFLDFGSDINYGPFDLAFAIRLIEFIRADQYRMNPPLSKLAIYIPKASRLERAGAEGAWLNEKIVEFGGYENVARRLNLLF